ncbi:MAG: hypothetical protein U0U09_02950 [Cyclobacteriaceae bacterium]
MKTARGWLFYLLLIPFLGGCIEPYSDITGSELKTESIDTVMFEVSYKECKIDIDKTHEICITKLIDNRCPLNVWCCCAGYAAATIEIKKNDEEIKSFELKEGEQLSFYSDTTSSLTLGKLYGIKVIEISPYPVYNPDTTNQKDFTTYKVKFEVWLGNEN